MRSVFALASMCLKKIYGDVFQGKVNYEQAEFGAE